MEIGVAGPIFTQKNIGGFMGQRYPYPTRWEKIILVIIHIYGALAIFILLYDNKDNESESGYLEIGVSVPISTHKNTKDSMGQKYPYSTIWEKNVVATLHIHGARAISYYFVIANTLNMVHVKQKWAYINQYLPIKTSKPLCDKNIHTPQYGSNIFW